MLGVPGTPATLVSLDGGPQESLLVANAAAVYSVGTTTTALVIDETPLDGGPTKTLVTPEAPWITDIALASDGTLYWTTDVQVQSIKP